MKKGFTLIEIIITISLFLMLFLVSYLPIVRGFRKPQETSVYDVLVSDVRSQQAKAFAGYGDQSIVFNTDSYLLSPDNFIVNLPEEFQFTNPQTVNITNGSGEVTPTTIYLQDNTSNELKTINLNTYGTIY